MGLERWEVGPVVPAHAVMESFVWGGTGQESESSPSVSVGQDQMPVFRTFSFAAIRVIEVVAGRRLRVLQPVDEDTLGWGRGRGGAGIQVSLAEELSGE